MWAMAWMKAARPSTPPSPRRGTSRGCTSTSRAGRPGMRIGSGGGASAATFRRPARNAAAYAWVNATLRSGSASARHRCAARSRSPPTSVHRPRLDLRRGAVLGVVRTAAGCARSSPARYPSGVAVEAGRIEVAQRRVALAHRRFHVLQILVDQPVAAQVGLDLFHGAVVRDQLFGRMSMP